MEIAQNEANRCKYTESDVFRDNVKIAIVEKAG